MKEQQIEILNKYQDKIKNMISSKSAGLIPSDLMTTLEEIAKEEKIEFCNHCASTFFKALERINKIFEDYDKENGNNKDRNTACGSNKGSKVKESGISLNDGKVGKRGKSAKTQNVG